MAEKRSMVLIVLTAINVFRHPLPGWTPRSCCSWRFYSSRRYSWCIPELTEAQLIALRFASDSELPMLVEKALTAKMPAPEIKKNIVAWRADTFRV
jgi:hypothetical protein